MMQSSTESQKCLSTAQDASTSATAVSDQPHQQPQLLENSSKPHPKLLNCLMKPSLSLTSLPPQSPKETGDETQSLERPYNSLKVSRPLMFISQAITIFHFTYIFRTVHNIHVVRTLDFCYKFFTSLKFKTNLPFIHFNLLSLACTEKAKHRKRTLASIMGITKLGQHNNIAHGNKRRPKWERFLGSIQLHYGHQFDRFV